MTKLRRRIVSLLMALAVAMPLAAVSLYLINPFGANSYDPRQRIIGHSPYRVAGSDMAPTLYPGKIVIVRAGYHQNHQPQRGEIVVFLHQGDGNTWVKRVIGLPGESVAINDGVVRVDGRELIESYVDSANATTVYSREMASTTVPQGSYFLLGDNRDNSVDARMFGATRRKDISGKVVSLLK
jgi:signal peptidase I